MRSARRTENGVALVVSSVEVIIEVKFSLNSSLFSRQDLSWEIFIFTLLYLTSINAQFRHKRRGFYAVLIELKSRNVAVVWLRI